MRAWKKWEHEKKRSCVWLYNANTPNQQGWPNNAKYQPNSNDTHKTPNRPLDQPNIIKYQRNEIPITLTLIGNSLINNIDPYKVKDLDIKKERAGKLHDCLQMLPKVRPYDTIHPP